MTQRATLRRRFETYRPEIEAIAEWVGAAPNVETVEGYIDSGVDFDVFRMSDPGLVAKLSYESEHRGKSPRRTTRDQAKAFVRGIGAPGLAQVVAYNDDRRRKPWGLVCGYVDGTVLRELTEDQRRAIPPEHYIGLVATTFPAMQDRGLAVDPGARNIKHYSRGFKVVDYELGHGETLAEMAAYFGGREMLLEGVEYKGTVPGYGLLYRDICHDLLGAEAAAEIEYVWRNQGLIVP